MDEFMAERVELVRQLADKADPFTKIHLLKLAERYDNRLGRPQNLCTSAKNRSAFLQ